MSHTPVSPTQASAQKRNIHTFREDAKQHQSKAIETNPVKSQRNGSESSVGLVTEAFGTSTSLKATSSACKSESPQGHHASESNLLDLACGSPEEDSKAYTGSDCDNRGAADIKLLKYRCPHEMCHERFGSMEEALMHEPESVE